MARYAGNSFSIAESGSSGSILRVLVFWSVATDELLPLAVGPSG